MVAAAVAAFEDLAAIGSPALLTKTSNIYNCSSRPGEL
jgi:hypothetical protein